jgi:hypothetical protein
MPYIKPEHRVKLDRHINELTNELYVNPELFKGNLNYIISNIINQYLIDINYNKINDMIGVLECCKLELYNRMAIPYEEQKCEENGDVYTTEVKDGSIKKTDSIEGE